MHEGFSSNPNLVFDHNRSGDEWESLLGIIVGSRTKVGSLGNHCAFADDNFPLGVENSAIGDTRFISDYQIPRSPDHHFWIDVNPFANLRSKATKDE